MSKSKRVTPNESIVSKAARATKRSVMLSGLYKKEAREFKAHVKAYVAGMGPTEAL